MSIRSLCKSRLQLETVIFRKVTAVPFNRCNITRNESKLFWHFPCLVLIKLSVFHVDTWCTCLTNIDFWSMWLSVSSANCMSPIISTVKGTFLTVFCGAGWHFTDKMCLVNFTTQICAQPYFLSFPDYVFGTSQLCFLTVVYVVLADTWLTNCVWQTLRSDSFDTIPS